MTDFSVFDGHCDTLYPLIYKGGKGDLRENSLQFSFNKGKIYKKYIEVLSMCVWEELKEPDIFMRDFVTKALFLIEKNNIPIITSHKDLIKIKKESCILGIEGGDMINSTEDLLYYYSKKVRVITLTWNNKNNLGTPAVIDNNKGLTNLGKETVLKMNELKMAVDISHLNNKGAKDVLNISKKPVIASHSCSYKINNNNRNMNDRIFKMLIKNKGVLGINFYPYFLTGNKNAKIKDIVSHIDHFMEIGGEKNIGLGSDFDGINVLPHNIKGNEDIYLILNELLKNNYSENIVKNIAYNNFYNAFIEIMR